MLISQLLNLPAQLNDENTIRILIAILLIFITILAWWAHYTGRFSKVIQATVVAMGILGAMATFVTYIDTTIFQPPTTPPTIIVDSIKQHLQGKCFRIKHGNDGAFLQGTKKNDAAWDAETSIGAGSTLQRWCFEENSSYPDYYQIINQDMGMMLIGDASTYPRGTDSTVFLRVKNDLSYGSSNFSNWKISLISEANGTLRFENQQSRLPLHANVANQVYLEEGVRENSFQQWTLDPNPWLEANLPAPISIENQPDEFVAYSLPINYTNQLTLTEQPLNGQGWAVRLFGAEQEKNIHAIGGYLQITDEEDFTITVTNCADNDGNKKIDLIAVYHPYHPNQRLPLQKKDGAFLPLDQNCIASDDEVYTVDSVGAGSYYVLIVDFDTTPKQVDESGKLVYSGNKIHIRTSLKPESGENYPFLYQMSNAAQSNESEITLIENNFVAYEFPSHYINRVDANKYPGVDDGYETHIYGEKHEDGLQGIGGYLRVGNEKQFQITIENCEDDEGNGGVDLVAVYHPYNINQLVLLEPVNHDSGQSACKAESFTIDNTISGYYYLMILDYDSDSGNYLSVQTNLADPQLYKEPEGNNLNLATIPTVIEERAP
ncbi:MAG: hypothetical protein ACPG8W_16915 [Candidatus Promineifilaceae bacterium]